MSIKYPTHIWDTTPECPHCCVYLDWEDGDEGDFYQPPYDGFWECPGCGESWDDGGPTAAEYDDAEQTRLDTAQ